MDRLKEIKERWHSENPLAHHLPITGSIDHIDWLIKRVELLQKYYEAGEALRMCESDDEWNKHILRVVQAVAAVEALDD